MTDTTDKKTWEIMLHETIPSLSIQPGTVFTRKQILEWFKTHYPKANQATVQAQLMRLTANSSSRHHHNPKRDGSQNIFFQINRSDLRLYDPETDPPPLHGTGVGPANHEQVEALAEPFLSHFGSLQMAHAAFDLMRDSLLALGISEAADERYAINRPKRRGQPINLQYGGDLILQFLLARQHDLPLGLTLREDVILPDDLNAKPGFVFTTNSVVKPQGVNFSLSVMEPEHPYYELIRKAYFEGIDIFKETRTVQRSKMRKDHIEPLGLAIFDLEYREILFARGLNGILAEQELLDFVRKNYPEAIQDQIERAEKQHREILQRYPIEIWQDMSKEAYALGQDDYPDSFSRWLEFETKDVGSIRGGSSQKFILFYGKGKEKWIYPNSYENVDQAWEAIRSGFQKALELGREGRWQAVDEIVAISSASAVRAKILYIYFKDELFPIFSTTHLKFFLKAFGYWDETWKEKGSLFLNRMLYDGLASMVGLEDITSNGLMFLLYKWRDPREEARKIVKIAPGKGGEIWEECLNGGYIRVGWDDLPSLDQFRNQTEFLNVFRRIYGEVYNHNKSSLTRKGKEVWKLKRLNPGDLVVANRGISEVLGIGEVTEDGYQFFENQASYKHGVYVEWDITHARPMSLPKDWALVTVKDVDPELYQEIVSGGTSPFDGGDVEQTEAIQPIPAPPRFLEMEEGLASKGQLILYGPPGTGKTYHCRRFVVWWLLKQLDDERHNYILGDQKLIEKAERELIDSSENALPTLTWVTFHPSYSYEDFVEGFRPVDTGGGGLQLKLEDGLFKRICKHASKHQNQPFVILIDEINRANLATVFGELITLIEKDKRRLTITLPQSRESFYVPSNVYIIGTMNTADRSIKMMDTALRRRFSFIEVMPEEERLSGTSIGNLDLGQFLDELNQRISIREGREKQIGHALLMEDGEPIGTAERFAAVFRQNILPLLQEYCFDDYHVLAEYLGSELVNAGEWRIETEYLSDPESLVEILAGEINKRSE